MEKLFRSVVVVVALASPRWTPQSGDQTRAQQVLCNKPQVVMQMQWCRGFIF